MSKVQKIPLGDVIVGERARKDYGDLTDLMESMRELKLLQPIVLAPGNHLLAGGRRLEAAKRLGWHAIPFYRAEIQDDAVAHLMAERDENTCRKDMTSSELVTLGLRIEELEAPAAKERQLSSLKRGSNSPSSSIDDDGRDEHRPRSKTDRTVSDALGVSETAYARQKRIFRAATGQDGSSHEDQQRAQSALEALDRGEASVYGAYTKAFPPKTKSAQTDAQQPGNRVDRPCEPHTDGPEEARPISHPAPAHNVDEHQIDTRSVKMLDHIAASLDGMVMNLRYMRPEQLDPTTVRSRVEEVSKSLASIRKTMKEIRNVQQF